MHLPIHTESTAPEESWPILADIAADVGLVPNLAATTATSPRLLQAFDGLRRAAGATELDPIDREIAGLATGVAVDNQYGVAFHSTVLANLEVADDQIEAMRSGTPPSDMRRAAIYEFAMALARQRGAVGDELTQRLRAQGFVDSEILDLVTESVFATFVGVVDNLAGRVELDAFLRSRAWKRESLL